MPNQENQFADGLMVNGDRNMIQIVMSNLLNNAWKFTSHQCPSVIEFGETTSGHGHTFYVRDNGAGFDMKYSDKLFQTFQRLHSPSVFSGIGIGLATVLRIVRRLGGEIWAKSDIDHGAVFFFTITSEMSV